jgi:hypothetical protein
MPMWSLKDLKLKITLSALYFGVSGCDIIRVLRYSTATFYRMFKKGIKEHGRNL